MAKGDKVFLIVETVLHGPPHCPPEAKAAIDVVRCAVLSVTAAQDVLETFKKSEKDVRLDILNVNEYIDPSTGAETRYVDPDTARKLAKKSK